MYGKYEKSSKAMEVSNEVVNEEKSA